MNFRNASRAPKTRFWRANGKTFGTIFVETEWAYSYTKGIREAKQLLRKHLSCSALPPGTTIAPTSWEMVVEEKLFDILDIEGLRDNDGKKRTYTRKR